MTDLENKVLAEVGELLGKAESLAKRASDAGSQLGHEDIMTLSSIAARGSRIIQIFYAPNSHYAQGWNQIVTSPSFSFMHSGHYRHISELCGILRAVQHDISSGLLVDIKKLIEAEIFTDFIEMAEHLLDTKYKDAAAVLLGAVLEDALRKIATAAGVSLIGSGGKPLTINPLNDAIAKTGTYGALVQKQVTTWANLRNDAAHGHFDKYDINDVHQMLLFVQKFCADYLK